MQFQLSTEYAIRIVSYLGKNEDELLTAEKLADTLGITYLYLMKLIRQLKKVGLVDSVQGCRGGYKITRDLEKITVYDVVYGIEGELCICPCLKQDYEMTAKSAEPYSGAGFFKDIQKQITEILKQTYLSDVTAGALKTLS